MNKKGSWKENKLVFTADNWEVKGNKLVFTENCNIVVQGQAFEEGSIVEVDADTVIKLGKPTPRLHTTRVLHIFKEVLKDLIKLEEKGLNTKSDPTTVLAYTSRTDIPNILKYDIEGMIEELESAPGSITLNATEPLTQKCSHCKELCAPKTSNEDDYTQANLMGMESLMEIDQAIMNGFIICDKCYHKELGI